MTLKSKISNNRHEIFALILSTTVYKEDEIKSIAKIVKNNYVILSCPNSRKTGLAKNKNAAWLKKIQAKRRFVCLDSRKTAFFYCVKNYLVGMPLHT